MGIVSIISVWLSFFLITFFEAGFHLYVYQGCALIVLPLIWLSVIVVVLLTYIPAEKMTAKIVSERDSFNAHILVNILCTVLMMSVLLTVIGTWIRTRSVSWEPIKDVLLQMGVIFPFPLCRNCALHSRLQGLRSTDSICGWIKKKRLMFSSVGGHAFGISAFYN